MNNILVFYIGFTAQLIFSARMIVQWLKSETAGRVLSPRLFWQLSLAGSMLLIVYGVLRQDVVIVAGQFVTYCIYVRNLMLIKGVRKNQGSIISICILFPIVSFLCLLLVGNSNFVIGMLNNKDIPLPLLIWGSTGQIIFSFRFVYQWLYSERQRESVLPLGFWIISLFGSTMLLIYAIVRLDPVIFLGQLFGTLIYTRNMIIHHKSKKQSIQCQTN